MGAAVAACVRPQLCLSGSSSSSAGFRAAMGSLKMGASSLEQFRLFNLPHACASASLPHPQSTAATAAVEWLLAA
jgi:hypothetical protein